MSPSHAVHGDGKLGSLTAQIETSLKLHQNTLSNHPIALSVVEENGSLEQFPFLISVCSDYFLDEF